MAFSLTAADISKMTQDAYSRGLYGERAWNRLINLMETFGWSAMEVMALLRSKHMRWFRDAHPMLSNQAFKLYAAKNLDAIQRACIVNNTSFGA